MYRTLWIFAVIFIACSSHRDRIVVPTLQDEFYQEAFERINKEFEKNKSNLQLVEQKLYYCERLEWPFDCVDALDELKRQKGMTPQLLAQYITFYKIHEKYEPLVSLIERWGEIFELSDDLIEVKIKAFVQLGKKEYAYPLLRKFTSKISTEEEYAFIARQFIELEDSLFATYYLGKLFKVNQDHPLIYSDYAYFLLNLGYTDQALSILESYSVNYPDDYEFHVLLSSIYNGLGYFFEARRVLEPFVETDTIAYSIANLYVKEEKWDSAHVYIDKIIERDSLNTKAWWRKARMYEDRGWLSYSLNYFNHVIYLDPSDTIAINRAALVRRKIAYLQRLKFEENKISLPILEPKTLKNNE